MTYIVLAQNPATSGPQGMKDFEGEMMFTWHPEAVGVKKIRSVSCHFKSLLTETLNCLL